jgi:hypothetical protein
MNNTKCKWNGGKAIDSGGYGCVFLPSLRCKNTANSYKNRPYISKLMENENAETEYNLIQQFNAKLKNIPNYSNYFLLDNFEICNPSQLTADDLVNYDEECSNLMEQGITSTNINSKLDKVKTINMPFGGVNIRKFIKNNYNSENLVKINNSLINLLQNGIIPMNELNVFHGDLKSSNMLADKQNDGSVSIKIIDWGLSFIRKNMNEILVSAMRPIHFNLPISVILLNKSFDSKLTKFISDNPNWSQRNAKIFTATFLNDYIKNRNNSHLNIIIEIINNFNSLTNVLSKNFNKKPTNYILDYVSEVVYKYTQNGKFNKLAYFNEVYLKNIDVWGFVTVYTDFYDVINSKKVLSSNDRIILGKIKKIFMETLFLNSTTPINIPILVNKLMDLNSNFQKITPQSTGGKFRKNKKSIRKSIRKNRRKYKNHKTRKHK